MIFTSILVLICTIGFKGEESVVKSNHDKIVIEGNTYAYDLNEFVSYEYKIIIRNTKNVTGGRYFVSYSYFTSQYKPPKDGPIPVM